MSNVSDFQGTLDEIDELLGPPDQNRMRLTDNRWISEYIADLWNAVRHSERVRELVTSSNMTISEYEQWLDETVASIRPRQSDEEEEEGPDFLPTFELLELEGNVSRNIKYRLRQNSKWRPTPGRNAALRKTWMKDYIVRKQEDLANELSNIMSVLELALLSMADSSITPQSALGIYWAFRNMPRMNARAANARALAILIGGIVVYDNGKPDRIGEDLILSPRAYEPLVKDLPHELATLMEQVIEDYETAPHFYRHANEEPKDALMELLDFGFECYRGDENSEYGDFSPPYFIKNGMLDDSAAALLLKARAQGISRDDLLAGKPLICRERPHYKQSHYSHFGKAALSNYLYETVRLYGRLFERCLWTLDYRGAETHGMQPKRDDHPR